MGEITTTTQLSTVGRWTTELSRIRGDLFSSAKNGSRIMSAFAMAEARTELMESIRNEEIKAKLIRMTDPEIAMVELANNPTEADRARICALAILTGFIPGDNEFGIFGGGGGKAGRLFVKESGYRTLFGQLGVVPSVQTDHPEYVPFGTTGKKVWRVGGRAWCDFADERYEVTFGIGENGIDFRLGINGYDSDNVAGIAAKARRQMLKMLWTMTSPVLNSDHADDESIIPQEPEPARIEQTPVETAQSYDGSIIRLRKMLHETPDKMTFVENVWTAIAEATTDGQLTEAGNALAAMKKEYSEQVLSIIRPFFKSRQLAVRSTQS
jgi:hypothetical protein